MTDLRTSSRLTSVGFKNKSFKKSVQLAIKDIQKDLSADEMGTSITTYSGDGQGTDQRVNLESRDTIQTIYLDLPNLYPIEFSTTDLFELSPKNATKKLFIGDNWITYGLWTDVSENLAPVTIDAGKGDDVIELEGGISTFAEMVSAKGGKGDDVLSFRASPYKDDSITNPRLTGGKGKDVFVNRQGCAVITDYNSKNDALAIDTGRLWYEHKTKSTAINGDLFIMNRKTWEPMFILEGITSIDQVTFVPADTL